MNNEPIFILAPPRSFTSLVCAVVGQHPAAYGLPELNLLMAGNMEQFWNGTDEDGSLKAVHWPIMRHGLLRTIAQLYEGEQTTDSIDRAYEWIKARWEKSTSEVYWELVEKISPLVAVEKSPGYLGKPLYLERIRKTFPNARYIHLLRNPRGQCESMLNVKGGKMVLQMVNAIDYSGEKPLLDPQILWHDAHVEIMDFLDQVPKDNWIRVRGEDFIDAMDDTLKMICDWLGWSSTAEDLAAMKHPEDSPFARIGPDNARLGNDVNFLEQPRIRPSRVKKYDLTEPLPWRPDNKPFYPEVVKLAQEFGYDLNSQYPEKMEQNMSGNDEQNSRQALMLAMRENFQGDGEVKFDLDEPANQQATVRGGRRRARRRGQGRAGGQAGNSAILQKVYKFLTATGPGLDTVPGTKICRSRIKQAIAFLAQRSEVLDGKKAQRVKRLLNYLTAEKAGDQMISGVNINHLSRFLERIERHSGESAAGTISAVLAEDATDASGGEYIDEGQPDSRVQTIETTLHQLVDITSRMSQQLQETQMRVDTLTREKEKRGPVDAVREENLGKDGDDEAWFTEYLD